jgi:phage terminase Nu1 subunit (DNA packaging protein)
MTPDEDDLMTRREVASLFGVVSPTVKNWARNERVALTEIRDDQDKPKYRRAEVKALYASVFRGFESRSTASRLRRRERVGGDVPGR